ncbi:unnamed protein product [Cunninghamella blakesleeana]
MYKPNDQYQGDRQYYSPPPPQQAYYSPQQQSYYYQPSPQPNVQYIPAQHRDSNAAKGGCLGCLAACLACELCCCCGIEECCDMCFNC